MNIPTISSIAAFVVNVIEHEGFIAVYGVVAWNWFHYMSDKRKPVNAKLNFKAWRKKHANDILTTVIVAFGMVIFDDELVDAYNDFVEDDITIQRWMYFLPGFITGRVLKWFYKEKVLTT